MDHSKVCGLPSSASHVVIRGVAVVTTQCHDWVSKEKWYTLRVCIFRVGRGLLAGCCIVYLNLGILWIEYTLRVCIFFVSHGIVFYFTRKFFFLTECTDITEFFRQRLKDRWFTLRVPSGFEFSPTDFLTRLLLCSAIRVNSIALAYRNNSQILLFRSFFLPQIPQILLIYTIRIYLVPTNLINFCSLRFALTSVNRVGLYTTFRLGICLLFLGNMSIYLGKQPKNCLLFFWKNTETQNIASLHV